MSITNIKIGAKNYKLKFGYGVNRRLADVYNIPTYSGLGEFIVSLDFKENAAHLSFTQLTFLGNLVHAAISYHEGENPELSIDEVVDALLQQPEALANIMQAFADSFPKENASQGKQKKPTRKSKK